MKLKRPISSSLLLLILQSVPLGAQTGRSLTVGPFGSRSFGPVDGTAPIFAGFGDCGSFSSGTISDLRIGAIVSTPELFTRKLGLSLRPAWRSSVMWFASRETIWVREGDTSAVRNEREYGLEVVSQSLNLGLLATYRIGSRMELGAGAEVGYRYSQTVRQTDRILGPGELAFAGGQTVRTMDEGPAYTAGPVYAGVTTVGSFIVPAGSHLFFRLDAVAFLDLLSPVREADWKGLEFGVGAGIVFDLSGNVEPAPELSDIAEPTPLPSLHLSASIDVYGLESEERRETITSRLREREYCRGVRLAPVIEFERGSVDLPQSYAGSWGDNSGYPTLDSLAALDPLRMQERMLDLVGLRLAADPAGLVELRSTGGEPELAARRMERVVDYLMEVWGVRSDQVSVESDSAESLVPDERGNDGGSVRIEERSPGILSPVLSRRFDRDFEAPPVKVTTSHRADAGLRSWEVVLASGSDTIARYSSGGQHRDGAASMKWNLIFDEDATDSSTLDAWFIVEDSTGRLASALDRAILAIVRSRIIVVHGVDLERMTETIAYALPGRPVDTAERWTDSSGVEEILKELDGTLREAASLSFATGTLAAGGDSRANVMQRMLGERLQPRGVAHIQLLPFAEMVESVRQSGECPEARSLAGSPFILMVRQPLPVHDSHASPPSGR